MAGRYSVHMSAIHLPLNIGVVTVQRMAYILLGQDSDGHWPLMFLRQGASRTLRLKPTLIWASEKKCACGAGSPYRTT